MAEKEIRQARAKVREREQAVWDGVERVGREARAADALAAKATASASAKPEKASKAHRAEVQQA